MFISRGTVNKLWFIHIIENGLAVKGNVLLIDAPIWTHLRITKLLF